MATLTLFIIFVSATVVFGNFRRYFVIPGSRVTNALWTKVHQAGKPAECCLLCDEYPNCTAVNTYMSPAALTRGTCELLGIGQSLFEPHADGGWVSLFKTLKDTKPMINAVATQSSVYWEGGAAERAIDGNTDRRWASSSCTHTADNDPEKWWMVEFQTVYSVTAVVIWNRFEIYDLSIADRLRDLTVYVAASSERMVHSDTICAAYTGPPRSSSDNPIQIDCQRTMYGRFLKIHKTTDGEWLTLCEVEIIQ